MQRIATVIGIEPDRIAEYKKLLAEAGPDGPAPVWTEGVGR